MPRGQAIVDSIYEDPDPVVVAKLVDKHGVAMDDLEVRFHWIGRRTLNEIVVKGRAILRGERSHEASRRHLRRSTTPEQEVELRARTREIGSCDRAAPILGISASILRRLFIEIGEVPPARSHAERGKDIADRRLREKGLDPETVMPLVDACLRCGMGLRATVEKTGLGRGRVASRARELGLEIGRRKASGPRRLTPSRIPPQEDR